MKEIETLVDYINEEICDAEKYAMCALKMKEKHLDLARTYMSLSEDELSHQDKLHNEAVKLINEYRDMHGEPPADMMVIYDYLHDKAISKVAHVRTLHDMFRR